jgi:glycosyltransferase involved in cell wall biosynthesis
MVPPDDAAALAAAINRLLSSRTERGENARAARASALARYNLPRLFADLDRLYRSLVA